MIRPPPSPASFPLRAPLPGETMNLAYAIIRDILKRVLERATKQRTVGERKEDSRAIIAMSDLHIS